jgi:hypothetical protein
VTRTIRMIATLAALAAAAVLTGCSSLSVNYDYDTKADFTQYRTYAWMARTDALPADAAEAQRRSDLLDRRIRSAIDAEMKDRGFVEDAAAPDVLVIYHVGMQDKIQVTDWGYNYSPYYWGYGGRQVDVYQYQEGTLIIDVVDAGTKNLVWRGTGTKVIESTPRTPEEMQARIDKIVDKIMQSFPPQGK